MVAYSPSIVTDGLVLYLDAANIKSYPGIGSTWYDLSGNGNNGTLVNGPTYNSNNKGSISFDGVNDYINCGNSDTLNLKRTATLCVWFKLSNLSFTWSPLISKMDSSGSIMSRTYAVFIYLTGVIYLIVADVTGQELAVSTPITTNTWFNWVGVIDRDHGKLTHYINGVKNNENSATRTTDAISHSNPVFVNQGGSGYNNFSGEVPQVQVYNRVLSAAEIQQNFNATRGRYGI